MPEPIRRVSINTALKNENSAVPYTFPPDYPFLLDMAQISNLCDTSPFKIKRTLSLSSTKRDKIYVLQRDLEDIGLRYNYIEYTDVASQARRRVISIRGTKNLKNIQSNFDSNMQYNEEFQLKAHRGYNLCANAIFQDFYVQKCGGTPLLASSTSKDVTAPIFLTGHSMGGCISILLAMLLRQRGMPLGSITTFGSPRFLDAAGVEVCGTLPLSVVEHCKDPITMEIPLPKVEMPFGLTAPDLGLPVPLTKQLHLLVPQEDFFGIKVGSHYCLLGEKAAREKAEMARRPRLPQAPDLKYHKMDSYVEILAVLAGKPDNKFSLNGLSQDWAQ